jgi:Zn-dependent protease
MFGGRFYLFTILGFPVYADFSWLIICGLLVWRLSQFTFPWQAPGFSENAYLVMGVLGAVGLFGSILLHEVGHMLEARRRRIPTGDITLHLFGGLAQIYASPRKPGEEATIALAGPAVTVLLAIVFFGCSQLASSTGQSQALIAVFDYLWFINAILLVFNLIPAFPLDGGRVLHSILWAASGKQLWAMRASATVGVVFAAILVGVGAASFANILPIGGGIWWVLIGIYLFSAANAARKGAMI